MWCPGGTENDGKGTLDVTGDATTPTTDATDAAAPRRGGRRRTATTSKSSRPCSSRTTKTFTDAVDCRRHRRGEGRVRAGPRSYERIEPVAESFGDLDPDIDARANDVPAAEWSGFHKIEEALYEKSTLDGMSPGRDEVARRREAARGRSCKTVELEPATIANGAVELLNEVRSSKITGEEERYSHIDLVDLVGNVEGAKAAFDSGREAAAGRFDRHRGARSTPASPTSTTAMEQYKERRQRLRAVHRPDH